MTNEELAEAIKSGHGEYTSELWERCFRLIYAKAKSFKTLHDNCHIEIDDLVQSGYFAFTTALHYYKPERGLKFTTYLSKPLLTEFLKASGWLTSKRDALDYAESMDVPVDDDGEITLADIIPSGEDACRAVKDKLFHEAAEKTISKALSKLPPKQAALLRAIYFDGQTQGDAGRALGYNTSQAAEAAHYTALRKLRYGAYSSELRYLLYEINSARYEEI